MKTIDAGFKCFLMVCHVLKIKKNLNKSTNLTKYLVAFYCIYYLNQGGVRETPLFMWLNTASRAVHASINYS